MMKTMFGSAAQAEKEKQAKLALSAQSAKRIGL